MNRFALAIVALSSLTSCANFPFFWRSEKGSTETEDSGTAPRAHLEFQDVRYDGQSLSGRLLISALESRLRLDKRLITSIALTTESVSECETGKPLPFIEMDVRAARPSAEDILLLEPGYWYGKDVRIPLFTESLQHPACIDAEFAFHAVGGQTVASVHVRAGNNASMTPDTGVAPSP